MSPQRISYATCSLCKQEMVKNGGCQLHSYEFASGETLTALVHDDDGSCHDCGVAPGNFHHPGCDWERCPRCGGQAIGCNCTEEGPTYIIYIVVQEGDAS